MIEAAGLAQGQAACGTIAFICPFWLPMWGGAEQYHYRLARALLNAGFGVKVICGVAAAEGRDNGDIEAIRLVPGQDLTYARWSTVLRDQGEDDYRNLAAHFAFIERAVSLCRDESIRMALVGNPFNEVQYAHVRELFLRLRDMGVKTGLIHHDLSWRVSSNLRNVYLAEPGGWENAARKVLETQAELAARSHYTQWTLMTGSPLFFAPDFVIANSEWSARFIDPLNQCEKRVLHPLMDAGHWSAPPDAASTLAEADLLMVNPQDRKNPRLMHQLIANGPAGRSYRVLKGGWGNAFDKFRPLVEALPPARKRQVELLEYVQDMRSAYGAARAVLFPSYEEGYGMTAVEAMYCGVPVISSNYTNPL